MTLPDKNIKLFSDYIADKKVLVADTNASSRASLLKALMAMNTPVANIVQAASLEDAEEALLAHSPHVVICDYDLGKRCGLDLLQEQRKQRPESKTCLFILVTGNTSQSAVATAAEEDVDVYILKPYTMEALRQSILKASTEKLSPNNYYRTIEDGKNLLLQGKPDEAEAQFQRAMKMSSRPSLAHYYLGQVEIYRKSYEQAQDSFTRGLEFNKIHYKCLIGLYDTLMERKLYKDAYELVKRISRYYPANPQRLSAVLRLAVMNQSYEEIERYYQMFTTLDEPSEELIKYICAALVICGKFYLQRNLGTRATELFEKAATTANDRTRILREIIVTLTQHNLTREAELFLKKFPAASHETADYLASELMVNDGLLVPAMTIEAGRQILTRGVHDPLVYKILIKRCAETNLMDYANTLMADGAKRWPGLRDEFNRLLVISPVAAGKKAS